jgi:hypothetical protein
MRFQVYTALSQVTTAEEKILVITLKYQPAFMAMKASAI